MIRYLSILFILTACSHSSISDDIRTNLVWPKYPEKPRIMFLKSVRGASDIAESSESWLIRFFTYFTGADRTRDLVGPYSVTGDGDGNTYVVDRDARGVFIFNIMKSDSRSFYYDAADPDDFPIGIAVASNIYMSFPGRGRVSVFNKAGRLLSEIGDGLKRPTGLAVNRDKGLLYIVDTLGHDVKVFDLEGRHLFNFGNRGNGNGEFNFPTNISVAKDGSVFITDELNFRVQKFGSDGNFMLKFGSLGRVPGTFQSPKGVTVDNAGHIYVADTMADAVQIFDPEGRLLMYFGGDGSSEGKFHGPVGIYADSNNMIYVADLYNARVQVFKYLASD